MVRTTKYLGFLLKSKNLVITAAFVFVVLLFWKIEETKVQDKSVQAVEEAVKVSGGLDRFHKTRDDQDRFSIFVETATGRERKIYTSRFGSLDRVTLSPSKKFVAAIERKKPTNLLFAIELQTNRKVPITDSALYYYIWNATSDQILHPKGWDREGGEDEITGLFLYDFAKQREKKITDVCYSYGWSRHDGNIYFNNREGVFRYNPRTERVTLTNLRGFTFSPDGKYYSNLEIMDKFRIFETATNQEITELLYKKFTFPFLAPDWYGTEGHLLHVIYEDIITYPEFEDKSIKPVLGVREYHHYLYDIEKDSIVKDWREKPEQKK